MTDPILPSPPDPRFWDSAVQNRDEWLESVRSQEDAARSRMHAGEGLFQTGRALSVDQGAVGDGGGSSGQEVIVFANGVLAVGPVSGPFTQITIND